MQNVEIKLKGGWSLVLSPSDPGIISSQIRLQRDTQIYWINCSSFAVRSALNACIAANQPEPSLPSLAEADE